MAVSGGGVIELEESRSTAWLAWRRCYLDTLAWALHWNGKDERAVEQAELALELAFRQGLPEETVLELERSLEVFEAALAPRR